MFIHASRRLSNQNNLLMSTSETWPRGLVPKSKILQRNPLNDLQEFCQKRKWQLPHYVVTKKQGMFQCYVQINEKAHHANDPELLFLTEGEAKRKVASNALETLQKLENTMEPTQKSVLSATDSAEMQHAIWVSRGYHEVLGWCGFTDTKAMRGLLTRCFMHTSIAALLDPHYKKDHEEFYNGGKMIKDPQWYDTIVDRAPQWYDTITQCSLIVIGKHALDTSVAMNICATMDQQRDSQDITALQIQRATSKETLSARMVESPLIKHILYYGTHKIEETSIPEQTLLAVIGLCQCVSDGSVPVQVLLAKFELIKLSPFLKLTQ